MSDTDEDETKATKIFYNCYTVDDMLNDWKINYNIPIYEIDFVRDYIRGLENEQRKHKN